MVSSNQAWPTKEAMPTTRPAAARAGAATVPKAIPAPTNTTVVPMLAISDPPFNHGYHRYPQHPCYTANADPFDQEFHNASADAYVACLILIE